MELKKLVKNTSYLASTKVVQFFAGIVRSKINAILLGTTGVGIVNQLTLLTNKMSQFTMLSMSEAVVKQIAENKDNENVKELVRASLKSYIVLVLSFMMLSIIAFTLFADRLTVYALGNTKYLSYFYIGLFSFPILIFNSIPFAILKGFKDVKSISIARIGIIISNLIVFVPLVLIYKLQGAVIFIPLSYVITLLFNYLLARKFHLKRLNIGLKSILKVRVKKSFVKELFLFSGFGLFVGSYAIISEFVCRSIVVTNLGVDSIGLYSPIITWAGLFVGFIIPSFSTYLYPRFAETKSNKEVSGILNDAIRLSTFLLTPLLFFAIPYRDFFIKLFYSGSFSDAGKYLPYHFIGVIFFVWWYIFTQSMTPTGRIKQHAFFYTLFVTLDMLVTYFLVPVFGLYGWMLKHMISPFIFFFIYYFYLKRSISFSVDYSNIKIMIYILSGLIALIVLGKTDRVILEYILGPILFLSTWFFLKAKEKDILISKVRSFNWKK